MGLLAGPGHFSSVTFQLFILSALFLVYIEALPWYIGHTTRDMDDKYLKEILNTQYDNDWPNYGLFHSKRSEVVPNMYENTQFPSVEEIEICALEGSALCQRILEEFTLYRRARYEKAEIRTPRGMTPEFLKNYMQKRGRVLSLDNALRVIPSGSRYSSPEDRKAASLARLETLG